MRWVLLMVVLGCGPAPETECVWRMRADRKKVCVPVHVDGGVP